MPRKKESSDEYEPEGLGGRNSSGSVDYSCFLIELLQYVKSVNLHFFSVAVCINQLLFWKDLLSGKVTIYKALNVSAYKTIQNQIWLCQKVR